MKDWTGNRHTTFVVIGASNHSDVVRQKEDYYATEPKAAELLLQHCHLDGPIWEPACGERHLASVFERAGYDVRSSDIIRRCDCEQLDFLSPDNLQMWNGDIVTNPPYKYAQQFVEHSLRLVPDGHKVCMFLKLTFLEGKARKSLFINTPPLSDFGQQQSPDMRHERRVRQIPLQCRGLRLVCVGQRFQRDDHRRVD